MQIASNQWLAAKRNSMKNKIIITLVVIACSLTSMAQMGIGTTTPNANAALELSSTSQGMLFPRMTSTQRDAITSPAKGLTIFNTTLNCVQTNIGTSAAANWKCLAGISASSNGSAIVSAYTCSFASAGTLTAGTSVSGVTQTITATVTSAGTYSISSTANGLTFAATGTFTGTGAQNIVLTASGTPTYGTTDDFTLNTTPNCSFSRTATGNASTNGTAIVTSYNYSSASGTLTAGSSASGVTQTITANVSTVGTYSISATANGVKFANAGTFASTGSQNVILTATGTPIYGTTDAFTINTNPNCTFNKSATGNASTNGTAIVSAYSCSTASAGTLTVGTAVSGVTQTITATVTTAGTYSISSTANGVTFAGAGTFTSTGSQNIVLTASGTPTTAGSNTFTLNTTSNCNFSRTVLSDLLLSLDAGNSSSYAGTGTTWTDLSGYGNNGTLVNGPTYSTLDGGSIVFDGVNDYVNCVTPSMSPGKISVNAWVKITTGSQFQHIVDCGGGAGTWHLAILNDNRPYFYNGSTYHTSAAILTVGQWYLLTGIQGTTLDIYINGVLSQSIATNVNVSNNTLNLGRFQGGGRYLSGNIAQVSIYTRAISSTEVLQLFNSTKARFGYTNTTSNGTATVSAYTCSTASSGTMTAGTLVSSVTQTITATVTAAGTYSISSTANGVTFAGAGTFAGTGSQNIVLTATGMPTAAGTHTFTLNTTPNCNFSRTTITVPGAPTSPVATAGNAQASVAFVAPVSNGGSAITSYTVTSSPGSFTATGASSPLIVTGLTNGTAYTFTVVATNAAGNSVASAASAAVTTFLCGTSTVTFTYNGSSVTYGTVSSAGGKCWLDRNLGATQVATSATDAASYGDIFQWGRGIDGHQIRTSTTITTQSSTDLPGHANFISSNGDWRSSTNNNLWQGVSGVNNPCPSGFRLPSSTEITTEWASWSSGATGAYNSPLKLPFAGYRYQTGFGSVGTGFGYWTSTVNGAGALELDFGGSVSIWSATRAYGFSVRCIKD